MKYKTKLRQLAAAVSMLILASAAAWAKPPSIIVGAKAIFLHTSPVVEGDEVFVPLAAVRALGASVKEDGSEKDGRQKMEVKPASGDRFHCTARIVGENQMFPIRDIAEDLGAVVEWDKAKNALSIRARLQEIRFDGAKLKVKASFPLACEIVESSWTRTEKKLLLDFPGLDLDASSASRVHNDTKIPIRLGMGSDGETGRVVLDLPFLVKARKESLAKTREITISVSPSLKDAPAPPPPAPGQGAAMPDVKPKPEAPKPVEVRGVEYRDRGSRRFEVSILADGPVKNPPTSMFRDPARFCIDLPNARLAEGPVEKDVRHSLVTGLRASETGGKVCVELDLTRLAAFDVLQEGSGRITITLETPKGAGGSLAGKTIAIDAGHGGVAGARGIGCLEKDVNLAVALRVEKLLKDAGAIPLMIRRTDKDVKLDERPAFAERHSADLFVSIHHNALGGTNKSITGTETFYHAYDPSSRALAYCLQLEVLAQTGQYNRKVKSDYDRYPGSGFAVLRGASMPSALIEVAFIDNAADAARARDAGFQQKVAEGIVRGIREYFEGSPGSSAGRPTVKVKGVREEEPSRESEEEPVVKPEPAEDSPAASDSARGSGGSLIPKGRVK